MRLISRNCDTGRLESFLFLHYWLVVILVIIWKVLILSFQCTYHWYFWLIMQWNFWWKWSFLSIVIILVVFSNNIVIESCRFLFVLRGIVAVNFILIEMLVFFSERKRVLYLNFFLWLRLVAHLNLYLYLLALFSHRIRYGRSSLELLLPFSKIYDFRFLVKRTYGGIRKVLSCSLFEKGFWLFDFGH